MHGKQGQKINYVRGVFTPTIGISRIKFVRSSSLCSLPLELIGASNRRLSLLNNCLLEVYARSLEHRRVSWLIPTLPLTCPGPGACLGATAGTIIRNTAKQKKEALTQCEVHMNKCHCHSFAICAYPSIMSLENTVLRDTQMEFCHF